MPDFLCSVALFELKESVEARRELEAVRQEIGEPPNVSYYLGRLDRLDQNYESAIRNFTKAMAKPPFPDTAYHLGFACFEHGDFPVAEKWLKMAAQLNPNDSVAQYQLALVYRKEGNEEEANQAFALSAEIRRRDADESQLRIECAKKLEQGLRDEARAVCQRLYDPGHAEKLTALGTIYGQHGDLEAVAGRRQRTGPGPLRRAAEVATNAIQPGVHLLSNESV